MTLTRIFIIVCLDSLVSKIWFGIFGLPYLALALALLLFWSLALALDFLLLLSCCCSLALALLLVTFGFRVCSGGELFRVYLGFDFRV